MSNVFQTIKKLKNAINGRGGRLLYETSEFYSEEQQRTVTIYSIKESRWNAELGKNKKVELFSTTSALQALLFLRDYWNNLNGWKLPPADKEWEEIRVKLKLVEDGKNGKMGNK